MSFTTTLDLNPKFTFFAPVRTIGLTRDGLAEQVDHAIIALDGRAPVGGGTTLEALNPLLGGDVLRVDLWVSDLDDYTCTYGFLISSENGSVPYARGERTVVNVDPKTHRAAKWSSDFRVTHAELLKDLPAIA
ncbi:MAG TPA: thioesterase family protein [Thermoanaerobaculia bacterium]|nr:thioesterase family protein [Thermoanaerobaculia bacterium]